jgi:hypothetical protein
MSLITWTRTARTLLRYRHDVLLASPPPAVAVTPTHEIRTVAAVNEVAVDGARAATLVGQVQSWEYMLVWSPKGIVVRASLACDAQESNIVLAGNRFGHVCFQDRNYVVTGTIHPLAGRVALRASGSTQVALAARGSLMAGSAGRVVWRFDGGKATKLRAYPHGAIVTAVDGDRVLVDRSKSALDVLSHTGSLVSTVTRPHEGGSLMRGGRIATLARRTLVVADLRGRSAVRRTIAADAHLEDMDGGLVVYSVETQLHLLRVSDGRDVRLRFAKQFGYAHARVSGGALFYAYDQRSGKLGHAGYVDAKHVRALLRG